MAIPFYPAERQLVSLEQLVIELYEIILEIMTRLTFIHPAAQEQPNRLNSEMPHSHLPLPDLLASVVAMSNNNNANLNQNSSSEEPNSAMNSRQRRTANRRCRCRRRRQCNHNHSNQQRTECMICQAPIQKREETEAADEKDTSLLSVLLPQSLTRNPVITAVILLIGWGVISRLR